MYAIERNVMQNYKNGPKEITPIPRMSDSTFHCLIRDSLFRDFAHQYEGENLDRLHGLMHDVAEETLARVSVIAPPVAAGSVDTPEFCALLEFYGRMYPQGDMARTAQAKAAIIGSIAAWGAQHRMEGKREGANTVAMAEQMKLFRSAQDEACIELKERAEKAEANEIRLQQLVIEAQDRAEKAEARVRDLEESISTDDRVLRSSVPERWKDCASPVGAVQSYIAELEQFEPGNHYDMS